MRSRGLRFLLLSTIFLVITGSKSNAELIRSTGNGVWNNSATWDLGRTPTDGDEIIIETGDTVILYQTVTLNNVEIEVRGELILDKTTFIVDIYAYLRLDSSSILVVAEGGNITSDENNDLNRVVVGNAWWEFFFPEWDGGNSSLAGPSYITDAEVGGGLFEGQLPDGYIPLPIELISFKTELLGGVVEVRWATAVELNNDYFTIERSFNGREWTSIGEVEGAGDSHIRSDYRFVDYNPVPGISYYRLRQTDFDGKFEVFNASAVHYEPGNLFKVFPNPVSDKLNLTTSSNLDHAVISLRNMNGQEESISINKNSRQATLDMSMLPSGIYVLEVAFSESRLSKRIVKQ
jgi:hypothetical protein